MLLDAIQQRVPSVAATSRKRAHNIFDGFRSEQNSQVQNFVLFPIHVVQQHVGEERLQEAALRRTLLALGHHAIVYDARIQIRPD